MKRKPEEKSSEKETMTMIRVRKKRERGDKELTWIIWEMPSLNSLSRLLLRCRRLKRRNSRMMIRRKKELEALD